MTEKRNKFDNFKNLMYNASKKSFDYHLFYFIKSNTHSLRHSTACVCSMTFLLKIGTFIVLIQRTTLLLVSGLRIQLVHAVKKLVRERLFEESVSSRSH